MLQFPTLFSSLFPLIRYLIKAQTRTQTVNIYLLLSNISPTMPCHAPSHLPPARGGSEMHTPPRSHSAASSRHILAGPHTPVGADVLSHVLGLLLRSQVSFPSCFLHKKPCVTVDSRVRRERHHPRCIAALGAGGIRLADANRHQLALGNSLFIFKVKPRVVPMLEQGIIATHICRLVGCKGPDSLSDQGKNCPSQLRAFK